ncbi:MAG: hypothetical protein AAF639_24480 [Chloroflexota bacterium]
MYVERNSDRQINLPADVYKKTMKDYGTIKSNFTTQLAYHILRDAAGEIASLIQDAAVRYGSTPEGSRMLQQLHSSGISNSAFRRLETDRRMAVLAELGF